MENLLNLEKEKILSSPELFYDHDNFNFKIAKKNNTLSSHSRTIDWEFHSKYTPFFEENNLNFYANQNSSFSLKLYTNLTGENNKNSDETLLILVHGLKSTNKKIYLQLAERFSRRGITSLVYSLPFHFERLPKNINFNQILDLNNFITILEFYRQSIIELRILINYFKEIGYKKVGCMGFSIGGHICDMLSCVEKNADFSIPLASTGNITGKLLPNRKKTKKNEINTNEKNYSDKHRDNLNLYLLENFYKLVNSASLKPVVDKNKILLIQGLFDSRAPLPMVLKLRRAWDYPPTVWYPCDHFGFFLFNRLTVKIVTKFLARI